MNAAVRYFAFGIVFFAINFTYLFIARINVGSTTNPGSWLFAALASSAIGLAALGVIWWGNTRRPGKRSIAIVATEAAGLGLILAVSYLVAEQTLGITTDRDPWLWIVSTTLTFGFFGFVISVVEHTRSEETERRWALLDEGATLAEAREDVAEIVHRMQAVLETDIDAALSPARIGIAASLEARERELAGDEWTAIATQLRTTAHETIRPLSKQLWSRMAPELPPLTVRRILRTIITQQPFQPLNLAMVYLVTSLPSSVSQLGWARGLMTLAVGVTFVFAVLGGANAAMRRYPAHHAALFMLGAIVLQLLGLLNFPVREWLGVSPYTWLEFALSVFFGLALILLTSGFGSVRSYRDAVARTLQADIDKELLQSIAASRQVAQLARESARILHGSVQTRLIACAVAIERAANTADVEAFQLALREAYTVLTQPTYPDAVDSATLAIEVERKVSLWSGLCTMTVEIDPTLAERSGHTARDVGRVVEEGLSNAIRHGGATSIHVSVQANADQIIVVIDDDGFGPQKGTPGLGSALLDSIATSWQLTPHGSGCRLHVSI